MLCFFFSPELFLAYLRSVPTAEINKHIAEMPWVRSMWVSQAATMNKNQIQNPCEKYFSIARQQRHQLNRKYGKTGTFSDGPVVKTALSMQEAQVWSLVMKVRSYMPYRGAKINKLISESESLDRLFSTPWTTESMNSPGQNTGWVAFPFSRGSSQLRDQTQVSRKAFGFFTS